ncbi:alpha-L-fucosidase [Arthrobacter sp. CDRTa11]|uniref:alpha-L-fucosidase n=1 Tax=Arthrobacter sp. CDRTa11 TaxID=2651199 RepID=UPI002265C0AA|nr:alpha-L-fucosidase [Arthrobacter sp. CDRTa11]
MAPDQAGWDTQALLQKLVDMRFGIFNHFNLGTFTDEEWAAPNQDPGIFAPPSVDTDQWADAALAAGMSYGVLTTKHHDGFALWPTKYGTQNVMDSGYRRDVVRQYVDSFRSRGLKVGFYFSIWDRTYPVQATGGYHVSDPGAGVDPPQIEYVLNQLTELLTGYGEIEVLMLDGYAWQMGHQQVPLQRVRDLVKTLQPDCVMIDICAVLTPWLGDAIFWEEPFGITVPAGNTWAGLQGQTISEGWFWHPSTPTEPLMSTDDIITHLTELEAGWTSFILNCAPNREGRLDPNVVTRLAEVGAAWTPNRQRGPLPVQPVRAEYVVTPVAAYASAFHEPEPPYLAIDGRADNKLQSCWSTWPGTGELAMPVSITLDLGGVYSGITTLEYLPKQWFRENGTDGDVTSFEVSASADGVGFTTVASGDWVTGPSPKMAEWAPVPAGFIRFTATEGSGGYTNVSGLRVGGRITKPIRQSFAVAPDRVYKIIHAASGRALTVLDGSTRDGAAVVLAPDTNSAHQRWNLSADADGFYKLKDTNSGMLLKIGFRSRTIGEKAAIRSDADVVQQQWAVTPVGAGKVVLTNRFSNHALGLSAEATTDGTTTEQQPYRGAAHQHWTLTDVTGT